MSLFLVQKPSVLHSGPLCYIRLRMNQKLTRAYVCAGTGHQSVAMTKFFPDINTLKMQRPKTKQYLYSQVFEVREVLKGLSVNVGQAFSISNLSVKQSKATCKCASLWDKQTHKRWWVTFSRYAFRNNEARRCQIVLVWLLRLK